MYGASWSLSPARELQPGQRLPSERELVKLLGTGRNSLREAMKVLEAMGILDIRHGSGIFLRKAGFQPGQDAAIWLVVHKNEIWQCPHRPGGPGPAGH